MLQTCENDSFQTTSADNVQFTGWVMGPSSSCLNDIDRDDFQEVLHIEEDDEENMIFIPKRSMGDDNEYSSSSSLRSAASEESISNLLDTV